MGLGVVLTAGGSGARFGGPLPKQFLEIRPGVPLLRCALETFHDFEGVEAVVLTLPPDRLDDWRHLTEDFPKLILAAGGADRWLSVRNGVEALPAEVERVLIHDAARPFTPHSVIRRCVQGLSDDTAVIAAVAMADTVKEVEGARVSRTLDRSRLVRVQTPQGFPRAMLESLYARGADANPTGAPEDKVGAKAPTDEAQIAEAAGFTVNWVEGSFLSRKITTPEDWEWAEWTLERVAKGLIALDD
jgi:2-C-methyl-D-erythritol 4-phosphate cytidylyltransferase